MKSLVTDLLLNNSQNRRKPPLRYDANLVLLSPHLIETFTLLTADTETREFLEKAKAPSMLRGALANCLRPFFSRTTSNGIAGRGGMFVLSSAHVQEFLGSLQRRETMLDIGAGDGGVTQHISKLFRRTWATEDSAPMRWRLWMRGYSVIDASTIANRFSDADPEGDARVDDVKLAESSHSSALVSGLPAQFDLVSCLNVLDRADKPITLLRSILSLMHAESYALLAVVLPWCPFVENGAGQKVPSETLPMDGGQCCKGATFEASLQRLVDNVLTPCGFEVVKWTRVPYLCEGSPSHEYYTLDDAVILLRKASRQQR